MTQLPSFTPNGPRHLLFRHARRLLQSKTVQDDDTPPPGYEHLWSFFVPGLQMRPYNVQVDQVVSAGPQSAPTLSSTQPFEAVGPKFALPDNAIHSVYPPQGHQEGIETLPHVIFNDPTLPWERVGSYNAENPHPPSNDYFVRNRVPWLAVLVFTQDELQLSKTDLTGDQNIFRDIDGYQKGTPQSPSLAVNLPMKFASKISDCVTPIPYEPVVDQDVKGDLVLVPRPLFLSLFAKYDSNGIPDRSQANVYRYRFLAHRRDINTQGMAVSSGASEDDSGSFGVVFSHRSGPFDITAPTTVFAHLVSIEGVEQMQPWPNKSLARFVAMSSLYSWSYVCLPPSAANVKEQFIHLGSGLNLLHQQLQLEDIAQLLRRAPNGPRLLQRLNNGFSLSRYRTQTGEPTACFVRGPFVPDDVPCSLTSWWTSLSATGTDLQILDQELGLMDISYSAAWQLRRTLAIADQAFIVALVEVRKQILDRALNDAQTKALKDHIFEPSCRGCLECNTIFHVNLAK